MSDQDAGDQAMSREEAARVVREEPALQGEPAGAEDDNQGTDDDATTPDRAVSNQE
jgi:hypothetical protein